MNKRITEKLRKRGGKLRYKEPNAGFLNKYTIRRKPFYVAIGCGVFIILIGIYMKLANQFASGVASYKSSGRKVVLNGETVICIGVFLIALIYFSRKEIGCRPE